MQYVLTLLEGIISFISPCMLPLLPLYLSYFAGDANRPGKTLAHAACFALGFTAVFSLLGLFAGSLGALLHRYQTVVRWVCGLLVILFGLSYLEIIRLPLFKGMGSMRKVNGALSAFVFGMIYSVSLTPCVGAFLGSALMLASTSGSMVQGLLLLVCYSLGLGIPFILSAVLLRQLNGAFQTIKKHYRIINRVCGVFLILMGVCMGMGWMNRLMALFS